MSYRHEPEGYDCPFCRLVRSAFRATDWSCAADAVLRTDRATAFIAPAWWPNNAGHVIIVPNAHYENLYVLPPEDAAGVHVATQRVALAMRATYPCEGTSTRQHNEPAGNKEVWHYHLHLFPRYEHDDLYVLTPQRRRVPPEERLPYAQRLRGYLEMNHDPGH